CAGERERRSDLTEQPSIGFSEEAVDGGDLRPAERLMCRRDPLHRQPVHTARLGRQSDRLHAGGCELLSQKRVVTSLLQDSDFFLSLPEAACDVCEDPLLSGTRVVIIRRQMAGGVKGLPSEAI